MCVCVCVCVLKVPLLPLEVPLKQQLFRRPTDSVLRLSQASLLFVDSAQYLFYTVALDTRDEAAACSFILSARLSHPLATVEVLVRDVQVWLKKKKKMHATVHVRDLLHL